MALYLQLEHMKPQNNMGKKLEGAAVELTLGLMRPEPSEAVLKIPPSQLLFAVCTPQSVMILHLLY